MGRARALNRQLSREQLHGASLSDSQRAMAEEAFKMFDKDGGGSISVEELGQALRALGQDASEEELSRILAVVDADGSGQIEFEEFLQLINKELAKHTENLSSLEMTPEMEE